MPVNAFASRLDGAFARTLNLPLLQRIGALIARFRYLLVGLVAMVFGVIDGKGELPTPDSRLFHRAGRQLLTDRWADVFSDPEIQVGPAQLLIYGLLSRLAEFVGSTPRMLISVAVQVSLALITMAVVGRLMVRKGPEVEVYVGLVTILGFISWQAFGSGHIAEAFIPLLWISSGLDLGEDRRITPALFFVLATSLKLWGVLGLVMFMFARSKRAAAREMTLSLLGIALVWGPFFLLGDVRMFDYVWYVQVASFVFRFVNEVAPVDWWLRAAQAAVSVGAGIGAFFVLRRSEAALWIVPAATIAVRLVIDPTMYFYYTLPLTVVLLAGVASSFPATPARWRLPAVALAYAASQAFFLLDEEWLSLWGLLYVILAITLARRRNSRQDNPRVGPPSLPEPI